MPDTSNPLFDDPRRPLSVTALVAAARAALENDLGAVRVTGEVSGFLRAASGHCYFSLKDASAQVRCVLWRTKARLVDFPLKDGMAVEVSAAATLYEPRGEFQLAVDSVRQAGAGALYERFVRLKARLEAQGWFANERKRALPAYPRHIGVVTSLAAAALRDVLTTLARRWPAAHVIIYPTAVQGFGAAEEVAAAIRTANARNEVEALIVCRGGGSIEDLWAFNEEVVAQAVFDSALPVIAGVGHETDFTIIDFVADVRAPTPTGAATLLTPDRDSLAHRLVLWTSRLHRALMHGLGTRTQRVDLAARALTHPAARLRQQRDALAGLALRIAAAEQRHVAARRALLATLAQRTRRAWLAPMPGRARIATARQDWRRAGRLRLGPVAQRLAALAQNLAHLAPQHVLERGYAIVMTTTGDVIMDSDTVASGDAVDITFARGRKGARIT